MANTTGEVIATPDGKTPYAVVIRHQGIETGRLAVPSLEAGKTIVADVLRRLGELNAGGPNA